MTKWNTTLLCAGLLMFAGCSSDSPSSSSGEGKRSLVLGMMAGESAYYGTSSLEFGKESGSDFYPHHNQAVPIVYGNWVFVLEVASGEDKITRYSLNDDHEMTNPQALTFSGGSQPANLFFVSPTKAYVSLFGSGRLVIINPETMKQTGTIDLSAYAAGGDGNPDPTSGIIRDGLLYVALSQQATMMSAFDTSACVAIVDVAADTVVKVISDERAQSLGGADDADRIVFMDENEDIYFYSNAMWGYQPGLQDGFLRIKKGETEFDPDYYFSIMKTSVEGVAGNAATYGLVMDYAGAGIVYSMLQIPALTSNPPDYVKDHNYQPVEIDLYNKTIRALPVSPSPGYAAMGVVVENEDAVLFGLSIDAGNGIYRYRPSTKEISKTPVLSTTGAPMTFDLLQD